MAGFQDAELLKLLLALRSEDAGQRRPAEEALENARRQPGFAPRLAAFAMTPGTRPDAGPSAKQDAQALRQMALTVLKQQVSKHWGLIASQDVAALRQALLAGLAEESSAIRGLLHACVVQTRAEGGAWPELQEQLGAGLTKGSPEEASCCVECIAALLNEGGPQVAASLGPLQGPLLQLAQSNTSPPALRRKCIDAHVAGVGTVVALQDPASPALQLVLEGLPAWMEAHAALCVGVEGWSDQDRVACAFSAVRAATTMSRFPPLWPSLVEGIEGVLRPACLLLQQVEPAYTQSVINSDDGGASEEEDNGPSQLVQQLMELVQALLPSAKLRSLVKGKVKSVLQLLVPFMRVTEAQVRTWRGDPNEFLAHEEDDCVRGGGARLSGEYLVGEVLGHTKREATRGVAGLVGELLEKGEQGRTAGDVHAWKLTELAFLLFGIAAGELSVKALQRGELAQLVPVALSGAGRLCADKTAPDFLRARSFTLLKKLGDAVCALSAGDVPALLEAAADGLGPTEPLVVRVSACRAFCRFLTATNDKALRHRLLIERGVLASLSSLMQVAEEELLHLTLESLCLIVKQCPDTIVSAGDSLAQLVLQIWRRSASDPMVTLQVLDVVSCATGSDPRLQSAMEEGLVPAVVQALQPGAELHITSAAVQLYGTLLKRAAVPLAAPLWQCVEPLLSLVMRCDESGLLENICDVMISLVRKSPSQVTDGGMLAPMLRCVERLLGPGLGDDALFFVGPLAMLLLSTFGKVLPSDVVVGLLRALVTRLARAERQYLQQELLMVVARLLHEDLAGVLSTLSTMQIEDEAAIGRSGLQVLLTVWFKNAAQIRARRARNITVSALCRLHDRCLEDPQLQAVRLGEAGESPLPEQILAIIVAGLEYENERSRRERDLMNSGDLDDEDDEDDEDDDDDDELEGFGAGKKGDFLAGLVDLDDDEDGGSDGSGEIEKEDPLYSLDLKGVVVDFLVRQQVGAMPNQELAKRIASAVAEARPGLQA